MPSVTEDFCAAMLEAARGPLPPAVERAAGRSLLNVLGTAVSAAGSDAVRVLLAAADEAGGAVGHVTVPGLARTLDPYWAALVIGTAAHLDDFDDTHLATVIHPGAASLAAVLSLVPETAPPGAAFLGAFAAGCEAQLRIGCAVSPAHYDHGWHITGTCGVFGAAVAASALLGLDTQAAARALSLAAHDDRRAPGGVRHDDQAAARGQGGGQRRARGAARRRRPRRARRPARPGRRARGARRQRGPGRARPRLAARAPLGARAEHVQDVPVRRGRAPGDGRRDHRLGPDRRSWPGRRRSAGSRCAATPWYPS